MIRQLSLKWFAVLSVLSLALALVAGYSLLSVQFFMRGVDSITAGNMAQVVESYVNAVPSEQRMQLNSFSGYQIAVHWDQMPESVRSFFTEPTRDGVLYKHDGSGLFNPPDEIIFLMRVSHDRNEYFISNRLTRETVSPLVGRDAERGLQVLVAINAFMLLTICTVLWLLYRRIARPVDALGRWARTLSANNLNHPMPDFNYPELNNLATLIRASLFSVQNSLEREHRFLRHSSHELRTPISVIRNNVELLLRMRDQAKPIDLWPVVARIDRASLAMKHLTEILLWLGRESVEDLPRSILDLDQLVRELVEDSRYLLGGKDISLIIETEPFRLAVATIPARIVLGNLIRNAFQHTRQGVIRIVQEKSCVEIVNDAGKEGFDEDDLGFGLGLGLVAQLTSKLDWPYNADLSDGSHLARVCLR
jgi:signal transduction histidine kinase